MSDTVTIFGLSPEQSATVANAMNAIPFIFDLSSRATVRDELDCIVVPV